MNLLVASSIFVSSFAWALFDTSRKKLSSRIEAAPIVFWLTVLQAPMFFVFGFFESWKVPSADYLLPGLASILINSLTNLWFIQAVSMAPLSLVIPVLSLTPVFTALGAYLGLGETLGFQQIAGVILIVVSTFFLGKAESSKTTVNDGSSVKKGVLLMGLVAVMWSITPIFDKICLREVPSSEHGFIQCAGIAIFFGVYLRVRGIPASFRLVSANFEWFSIAVLFASIALFTQLWAIQVVQVGIFEALKRSVGLVAALLLGHFLFAERISRIKVGLVGLIAVGIFVLLV